MLRGTAMDREARLDASGVECPRHVLLCKARLHHMEVGEDLHFVGTERGCAFEIPRLAQVSGAELLEERRADGRFYFRIRKRYHPRPPSRPRATALVRLTRRLMGWRRRRRAPGPACPA